MKKSLWAIIAIIAIVLIDQITKGTLLYLITGSAFVWGAAWTVVPVPYLMRHVTNFFNVVFTWNPGTAFSLFRNFGDNLPMIMTIATGAIIALILYYLFARARNLCESRALTNEGVEEAWPETVESSLMLAHGVLEKLGVDDEIISHTLQEMRDENYSELDNAITDKNK